MDIIAYFDLEVNNKGRILDIGAVLSSGETFHSSKIGDFIEFISDCTYLCGHNIIEHDYQYIKSFLKKDYLLIDTLYLSPILFPEKPYHKLLKDDKLLSDNLNNPLSDSKKAKELFEDEVLKYQSLNPEEKKIYSLLLGSDPHFKAFFKYVEKGRHFLPFLSKIRPESIIQLLSGKVCHNANIPAYINSYPLELAYAIALIQANDRYSIFPAWVSINYPQAEAIMHALRNTPCGDCPYCNDKLNSRLALKKWFAYKEFRTFNGEDLQQKAVEAAMQGKSLLAIFPTGGGKSLTFQLPALIAGESEKALTVVISPLQSLMKDQVENLEKKGIADAVYINGLLSPIERANALERIANGSASILYIAPEQLRSNTIERLLLSRNISRFVIDEAHCFSAWGQDFRIEYMYIGEFLRNIKEKKGMAKSIPVSCFTATAKPKVISDIIDYFNENNDLFLEKYTTNATRNNLKYRVLHRNKEEKYNTLRSLLEEKSCPSIIYVSRTRTAEEIAQRLTKDGLEARCFHGQLDTATKIQNQEDFIDNTVRIIVATSAFGMGVDKSDVGLVIHYEISDSLENYMQEAGRAGRDINSEADCYVLYNDDDLNNHFILLNQTKLTLSEINQVWSAIKHLTQHRNIIHISALEIARSAGWEEMKDVETKVKSALAALENAGYIKRGKNSPRIYATGIIPNNMDEAVKAIEASNEFTEDEIIDAKRIIKSLISERSFSKGKNSDAESRIDYLSDMLGIETSKVINCIEKMRIAKILENSDDMVADIKNGIALQFNLFSKLESFIIDQFNSSKQVLNLKILNEKAQEAGIGKSSIKHINSIIIYWSIKSLAKIRRSHINKDYIEVELLHSIEDFKALQTRRFDICNFIIKRFTETEALEIKNTHRTILFSTTSLYNEYKSSRLLDTDIKVSEIQDALLYLSKTSAISIDGGFMIVYNKLEIEKLSDNKSRYKKEDYKNLEEFYAQRIKQIHIVGEYANLMVKDYDKALNFIQDYFMMDFNFFIKKYFEGNRSIQISRNISAKKHKELFDYLTDEQQQLIDDNKSRFIVAPAGPGCGKTYVLVRKLASLVLMEDIKYEKLLMLTFSRAAATEFKFRLQELIGGAVKFIDIKTFHSFCFDILGKPGSLDSSTDIVKTATQSIRDGQVELSLITKSILVIDEAQDMSADEYELVQELISINEDIRVIAVGDDDQNIYAFRKSDSKYFASFISDYKANVHNLTTNFRSRSTIVDFANRYIRSLNHRIKTKDIIAANSNFGTVQLTKHSTNIYEEAILNDIQRRDLKGSTAILCFTNSDALNLYSILSKSGLNVHLVQTLECFKLNKLAEIKYFLDKLKTYARGGIKISKDTWEGIKRQTLTKFQSSINIEAIANCLSCFEKEFLSALERGIYLSDFESFLFESSLESFHKQGPEIEISTIHKAKGREWDNVYLSLKDINTVNDEIIRTIYVGITRAKNCLNVHFHQGLFPKQLWPINQDNDVYDEPKEILLQLGHKDVYLDFFKSKYFIIQQLVAGQELSFSNSNFSVEIGTKIQVVAKLSKLFCGIMSSFADKGYIVSRSYIRHIVYWGYEDENGIYKEIPIILPDIWLLKNK